MRPILKPPTLPDPQSAGEDAELRRELQEKYEAYNEALKKFHARKKDTVAAPEPDDDKRVAAQARREMEEAVRRRKEAEEDKRAAAAAARREEEQRAAAAAARREEEQRAAAAAARREDEQRAATARRRQDAEARAAAKRQQDEDRAAAELRDTPRQRKAKEEARRLLQVARERKKSVPAAKQLEPVSEETESQSAVRRAFAEANDAEEAAANKNNRSATLNRKAKLLREKANAIVGAQHADKELEKTEQEAEAADYRAIRAAEAVVTAREAVKTSREMFAAATEEIEQAEVLTEPELVAARERQAWFKSEVTASEADLDAAQGEAITSHRAALLAEEARRDAGRASRRAQERLAYVTHALQVVDQQERHFHREESPPSPASTATGASAASSATATTTTGSRVGKAKKKLSFSVPSPTPDVAMAIVRKKMVAAGKQLFGVHGGKMVDDFLTSQGKATRRRPISRAQLQAVLHNVRDNLEEGHVADSRSQLAALGEIERQQEFRDRQDAGRVSNAMTRLRAPGLSITDDEAQRVAATAQLGALLALDAETKARLNALVDQAQKTASDEHGTPVKSRRREAPQGSLAYSVGKTYNLTTSICWVE